MDWDLDADQGGAARVHPLVLALRRDHPSSAAAGFFASSADHGGEQVGDIAWFEPNGEHMDAESWANGYARSVAVFLNGDAIHEPDPRGQRIVDDSFLICFNAHYEAIDFTIPTADYGAGWQLVVDTTDPAALVTMHLRRGGHRRAAQRRRLGRPPASVGAGGRSSGRRKLLAAPRSRFLG